MNKQIENGEDKICKNCGAELIGPYCHNCGQYSLNLRQNFWSFIVEYCSNTFQLDSRLLPTLRLLFCKPGELTREFFKGRINSYMHPLKMNMFLLLIVIAALILPQDGLNTNIEEIQDDMSRISENLKDIFQSYMPLAILLLTPFMGLCVKLFNLRSHKSYMEHYVFSLHVSAFLELVIAIYLLIETFWESRLLDGMLWVITTVYMALALHNYYGDKWIKSTFKALIINFMYFTTVIIAIVLLALVFVYQNMGILKHMAEQV